MCDSDSPRSVTVTHPTTKRARHCSTSAEEPEASLGRGLVAPSPPPQGKRKKEKKKRKKEKREKKRKKRKKKEGNE